MKAEGWKEAGRRHELREEWQQALEAYRRAVELRSDEEDPDISLHNRIGDLQVRIGELGAAVSSYEAVFDLYLEAGLPNNAIAVCRKIMRAAPGRPDSYLRMGRVRASQGLHVDARQNFLTYAEMMEARGETDEALRALGEFVAVAVEDPETREFLADQLLLRDRKEEGIRYLTEAHHILTVRGEVERAEELSSRLRDLDPEAGARVAEPAEGPGPGAESGPVAGQFLDGFEATAMDWTDETEEESPESPPEPGEGLELEGMGEDVGGGGSGDPGTGLTDFGGIAPDAGFDEVLWSGPEVPEPEEEGAPDAEELPFLDLAGDDHDLGEFPEFHDSGASPELEFHEHGAGTPDVSESGPPSRDPVGASPLSEIDAAETPEAVDRIDWLRSELDRDPDRLDLHRRRVELVRAEGDGELLADAFLGLSRALERAGEMEHARAVAERVLGLRPGDPDALSLLDREGARPPREASTAGPPKREPPVERPQEGSYVDLGAWNLDEPRDRTTRWTVHAETPTADEDADFQRTLARFREKVSEHIGTEDAQAHYDLGMAYREMGLLDEAIEEFQQALRTDPGNLATIEMLGQSFLDKGQPEVAIHTLERGVRRAGQVEDDLLGIYYFLGIAHEAVGNAAGAREFYERVFALDINFQDVTDRLKGLR